jgi:hypothetical protein
MTGFAEHVDLNKIGIIRLDEFGRFAVIANRTLHQRGAEGRFAVANTIEQWVDSVRDDFGMALAATEKLNAG